MVNTTFSPPNILVVDDVNANLALLTELIHNAGYIARPVTSAVQAANAIEALIPNLILLDISMPGTDGYVFCSMLKKNAKTRGIPVIFISAMNTPEDRIKGYEAGAVDFVAKPYEAEELLLRIGIHLKMYNMQQELELYNKKLNKIIDEQIGKIYEEQKNIIYALVKLMERRNHFIGRHLENIGRNSRILAMSLQLSTDFKDQITNSFIDAIEITSKLYDIGNITIRDNIIWKTSELNKEEMEVMKMHTLAGADILEDIFSRNRSNELMKMAIEIVKYHHENWDGSGYPEGLKGTQIPLHARIVRVVDAYDSLIYKKDLTNVYSHEESMKIINEGSGSLFDPDIIKVFNIIQEQLVR